MDLKGLYVLRQNVRWLLTDRKESEATLAQWLGFKHRSSLNKFLNNERAGFQMARLDRLGAFFGLPVYQLFQPGISRLTERRTRERRTGHERRIGHTPRVMLGLAALAPYRPSEPLVGEARHGVPSPDVAAEALRLTREYEGKLSALLQTPDVGRQAPAARKRLPKPPANG